MMVECPWCGAEVDPDYDVEGNIVEIETCDACDKDFMYIIDWEPIYTSYVIKCYGCKTEVIKAFQSKFGPVCSEECRKACDYAYAQYVGGAIPRPLQGSLVIR